MQNAFWQSGSDTRWFLSKKMTPAPAWKIPLKKSILFLGLCPLGSFIILAFHPVYVFSSHLRFSSNFHIVYS